MFIVLRIAFWHWSYVLDYLAVLILGIGAWAVDHFADPHKRYIPRFFFDDGGICPCLRVRSN